MARKVQGHCFAGKIRNVCRVIDDSEFCHFVNNLAALIASLLVTK